MMGFDKKLLVGVVTMVVMVTYVHAQDLPLKTDPEVIKLCDKNGDGVVKGKEYLCFLDLKKKKAEDGLNEAKDEGKKLDEDIKKLDEDNEKLDEDIKHLEHEILKLENKILSNN